MLSYKELEVPEVPEDRRTEVEIALENLIDIYAQIERNVKWVLNDDPYMFECKTKSLHLDAIHMAMSNMIEYLEKHGGFGRYS
jgi:hypothetical protein